MVLLASAVQYLDCSFNLIGSKVLSLHFSPSLSQITYPNFRSGSLEIFGMAACLSLFDADMTCMSIVLPE